VHLILNAQLCFWVGIEDGGSNDITGYFKSIVQKIQKGKKDMTINGEWYFPELNSSYFGIFIKENTTIKLITEITLRTKLISNGI